MPPTQDQIVQFLRDPQRSYLELRYSRYRTHAFDRHLHDSYAIGVVKQGRTRFFHHNQDEIVQGGEITLLNPGEVHACNPQPGSVLAYYMLYVDPVFLGELAAELSGVPSGSPHFHTVVVHDTLLHAGLLALCAALLSGETGLEVETRLYEAFSTLLLRYSDAHHRPSPPGGALEKIVQGEQYLNERLAHNISLDELAAGSGLSPYHFLRLFRQQYGVPPHAYQLQQRINQAKRMLAAGHSIAQTALEVGFADQSHFTRKFKALVGATPRQYQRASRSA